MNSFYYLYLPQLFLNSEYRECEQITYIDKEHYDWLKSISQKARHFLSEHSIGMRRIAGVIRGKTPNNPRITPNNP